MSKEMNPKTYTRYLEAVVISLLDERGDENIVSTDDHPSLAGTFSPLNVREAIAIQRAKESFSAFSGLKLDQPGSKPGKGVTVKYVVIKEGWNKEVSRHDTYDAAEASINIPADLMGTAEYSIKKVYTNKT